MMLTVQELLNDVVSRIDINNRKSMTQEADLMPAINRAWGRTVATIALKSEEYFMATQVYDTISVGEDGDQFVLVPEDALHQRIMSVEYVWPSEGVDPCWHKAQLINQQEAYKYRDLSTDLTEDITWFVMGRKLFLISSETILKVKVHYVKRPPSLVLPQGQIYAYDETQKLLVVSALGADLSLQISDAGNFINIVDGQTGDIKSTHQILSMDGTTKLYIRETPLRTNFRGLPLTGSFPATLEIDDYICLGTGTCVVPFEDPVYSTLLEIAVAELDAKMGEGDKEVARRTLKEFEKKVDDLRINVPNRKRVNATAPWSRRFP